MPEASEYCRAIEAYLCRKNEGHLVRIVGPVFEQVSGWAVQGVPLAIAFRGIDQYCGRYYAKGPRRRPVRIEFCEADILELFDDWRRAVGVSAADIAAGERERPVRRDSLPAHLDRAMARLTMLRGSGRSPAFERRVDDAVRELDGMRAAARHVRGEARAEVLARLATLDRELLDAARDEIDRAQSTALRAEAEAEIAPFAGRMTADASVRAIEAAFDRLLRDAIGLPVFSAEP
jgi:vacuolar-type H+-ATPase subunit H